jgi:hypothetical protein
LTDVFLKGGLKYTKTHVWFIEMGGFEIQCTDGTHRLDATEVADLITNNTIPISSIAITEEEISDRSKTDQLSRLIACLQIMWFVIQLTGRAVQRLPVTNLELFTLGIVVCSLGTYAAYWQRPQDICLPIAIPVSEGKALRDVFAKEVSPRARFSSLNLIDSKKGFPFVLTAIITGIFGACHLIGWDFLYPSSVEQLLWRISSIFCVVIPFLLSLLGFILPGITVSGTDRHQAFVHDSLRCNTNILLPLFCTLSFLYPLVRVYLLVAVFMSLRSVPAGVYQTVDWSLFFPHL